MIKFASQVLCICSDILLFHWVMKLEYSNQVFIKLVWRTNFKNLLSCLNLLKLKSLEFKRLKIAEGHYEDFACVRVTSV